MGHRLHSYAGCYLHWILILSVAMAIDSARAACYKTPAAAIDSFGADSVLPFITNDEGYRVSSIQLDPLLGEKWAMISSCHHPAWPMTILQVNKFSKSKSRNTVLATDNQHSVPVVHAGDVVRLWRQESLLRIEVAGISEENGDLGKVIRVRLLAPNTDGPSSQGKLSGIVRGQSNVEMQP